jgi:hypothetical protein
MIDGYDSSNGPRKVGHSHDRHDHRRVHIKMRNLLPKDHVLQKNTIVVTNNATQFNWKGLSVKRSSTRTSKRIITQREREKEKERPSTVALHSLFPGTKYQMMTMIAVASIVQSMTVKALPVKSF